jgi:hypothetical protein
MRGLLLGCRPRELGGDSPFLAGANRLRPVVCSPEASPVEGPLAFSKGRAWESYPYDIQRGPERSLSPSVRLSRVRNHADSFPPLNDARDPDRCRPRGGDRPVTSPPRRDERARATRRAPGTAPRTWSWSPRGSYKTRWTRRTWHPCRSAACTPCGSRSRTDFLYPNDGRRSCGP